MTLQTFSIIIFIGILLYVLGKQFDKYPLRILSGLLLFLCGVMMLMTPMINLTDTANITLGAILFGLGAYMWVTDTIEAIWPKESGEEE
jgi:hypothetical protein